MNWVVDQGLMKVWSRSELFDLERTSWGLGGCWWFLTGDLKDGVIFDIPYNVFRLYVRYPESLIKIEHDLTEIKDVRDLEVFEDSCLETWRLGSSLTRWIMLLDDQEDILNVWWRSPMIWLRESCPPWGVGGVGWRLISVKFKEWSIPSKTYGRSMEFWATCKSKAIYPFRRPPPIFYILPISPGHGWTCVAQKRVIHTWCPGRQHPRPGGAHPLHPPPPAGVHVLPRWIAPMNVNGLTLQSAWAVEILIVQRNIDISTPILEKTCLRKDTASQGLNRSTTIGQELSSGEGVWQSSTKIT